MATYDAAAAERQWNDTDPASIGAEDLSGPFEGPEKLLELWFAPCLTALPEYEAARSLPHGARIGLRRVPKSTWESMLDMVKCKTLSTISTADVDAYLLSESSMFVYPHKIVLKTCGTTTLLLGLERLLRIAKAALFDEETLGVSSASVSSAYFSQAVANETDDLKSLGNMVYRCFYSRKSFMFPEKQKGPHRDWMLETQLLDRYFDNGAAYTVGKMNGSHWLLYMAGDQTVDEETPDRRYGADFTLEILMTELAPESTQCYYFDLANNSENVSASLSKGHVLGAECSQRVGLASLFPDAQMDAFAFEPCGYSANALVPVSPANSAGYWTVHVTPEQGSSYASFETNVLLDSAASVHALAMRVINVFKPGNFTLTLFVSVDKRDESGSHEPCDDGDAADIILSTRALQVDGYRTSDRIVYEFDGYNLLFLSFQRT
ncbi:adenosylmethionine decarboxylase [Malassezia cuniculi]|uniref:adenosylmethionine decarboxylase n=1 Tax=Malassezia cuniculi TaxID=948313 RepID=A0AAF0EY53_9BASI|nr:adenosylmethionine decarboxylase [Malassezia cuniculi]